MGRYNHVVDKETGKVRPAHCIIWEKANGRKIPKGYDVHHKDGNGHNNNPKNLVLLTHSEHIALHHKLRREGMDPVDPTDPDIIKSRKKHHDFYLKNREKINAEKKEYVRTHKDIVAQRMREYNARNKDVILEKRRIYKKANADRIREVNKKYREEHREERLAYNRRYDAEHAVERAKYLHERYEAKKEEIKAQHAEYRASHRAERCAYNQQYREQHRDLIRAKGRLYMAKRRGASPELIQQYEAAIKKLETPS